MQEIIVREIEMPYSVKGCVVLDEDDNYNVYINALISDAEKMKALIHETEHIYKHHFNCYTAAEAERNINGYA